MTVSKPVTYRDSGVDIDAGNSLVERIKPFAKRTNRSGVMGGLGGFGGLFDLKQTGYKDPILVSGTDGVGTKLLVAIETGQFDTIGQDLVAMCVNDIIVQGAEPLFFLDYFATGQLDIESASTVIKSIAKACEDSGCALSGGETAEMPTFYAKGHFDLAGFAVGAVEREALLPRTESLTEGDVIVGIESSGPHSNGYSLLRLLVKNAGLSWTDKAPWSDNQRADSEGTDNDSVADHLLTPTYLYVKPALAVMKAVPNLKAFCHITGGGLLENLPRVLPDHLAITLNKGSWTVPAWCKWATQQGNLPDSELYKTFNAGIGFCAVVPQQDAQAVIDIFGQFNQKGSIIGRLQARSDSKHTVEII